MARSRITRATDAFGVAGDKWYPAPSRKGRLLVQLRRGLTSEQAKKSKLELATEDKAIELLMRGDYWIRMTTDEKPNGQSLGQNLTQAVLVDGEPIPKLGNGQLRASTPKSPRTIPVYVPLPAEDAWAVVRANAERSMAAQQTLKSVVRNQRYRITRIENRKIHIDRMDGRKPTYLSEGEVQSAIIKINREGGRVLRQKLIGTVAKEVALVQFHPGLEWASDGSMIFVNLSERRVPFPLQDDDDNFAHEVSEVPLPTDDQRLKKLAEVTLREGQTQFRDDLRDRYGDGCQISRCSVMEVVQACHVRPYMGKASNRADNGILLRVDLHVLFDANLIGIEPSSELRVHVNPLLKGTDYFDFDLNALRVGDERPNEAALRERWAAFQRRLPIGHPLK